MVFLHINKTLTKTLSKQTFLWVSSNELRSYYWLSQPLCPEVVALVLLLLMFVCFPFLACWLGQFAHLKPGRSNRDPTTFMLHDTTCLRGKNPCRLFCCCVCLIFIAPLFFISSAEPEIQFLEFLFLCDMQLSFLLLYIQGSVGLASTAASTSPSTMPHSLGMWYLVVGMWLYVCIFVCRCPCGYGCDCLRTALGVDPNTLPSLR